MVPLRAIARFAAITLLFSTTSTSLPTAALAATAPPAAAVTAATVISLDGKGLAKLRRKSGVETSLALLQQLNAGDKITTDDKTVAQLALPDGTIVRVGINTEYRIESVRTEGTFVAWVFNLARGSIRAIVEKSAPRQESKFRINTPAGTMGVRGTEFLITHDDKTNITTLYTIEGKVGFGAPKCEAEKNCIEVKEGEMSSIGGNAKKPEAVKAFRLEELMMQTTAELKKGKDGEAAAGDHAAGQAGAVAGGDAADAAKLSVLLPARELGTNVALLDDTALKKAAAEAAKDMEKLQDSLLGRDSATREAMMQALRDGTYNDRQSLGAAAARGSETGEEATAPLGAGATAVKNFKAANQYQAVKDLEQKTGVKVTKSNEEADKELAKLQAKMKAQTSKAESQVAARINSVQSNDATAQILRDAANRLKAMYKARDEARAAGDTAAVDRQEGQIDTTIQSVALAQSTSPAGAGTNTGTATDTNTSTRTDTRTSSSGRTNCGHEADAQVCKDGIPRCNILLLSCGYYRSAWRAQCNECDMQEAKRLKRKGDDIAETESRTFQAIRRFTTGSSSSGPLTTPKKCYKVDRVCELKMIPCDLTKGKQCSARYENKCQDRQIEIPCR